MAVALSGNTAVIGAFADDVTGEDQGAAYVFTRSDAAWTQQKKLTAGDGAANDFFGISVAISGDTVVVGASGDDIGANANQGSAYIFGCPACQAITLNPDSLPDGVIGASYSQTVTATGGAAPFNFTISAGALPTGMSLSSAGLLSGAPTASGAFNFTAQVTDANGCQGTRAYSLTITSPCETITLTPGMLPGGTVGAAYSQTINARGGAARPATFTVSAGNLPTGLSLSADGVLSGTPFAAGSFDFTVRATDTNGCQGTRSYTLIIN